MAHGIDYGMGQTNIDHETGIRFGVISMHEVCQAWSDSAESDYGAPNCPKCASELGSEPLDSYRLCDECGKMHEEDVLQCDTCSFFGDMPELELIEPSEHHCIHCHEDVEDYDLYGDTPLSWYVDDGEYKATQGGDDSDIFVCKSPYFTYADLCSPCAPGACSLNSPIVTVDEEKLPEEEVWGKTGPALGNRAYCFGHEWFWDSETKRAPYPVYSVKTGELVLPKE